MYALHPITVHFPIALLLANGLFTVLYLRRGEAAWETSAYHCLLFGWISGVVALLSGSYDALRQLTGPAAITDTALINWTNAHAFINIAALVLYGQALLQRRRNPALLSDQAKRAGYLLRLGWGACLLVIGGWIGGRLVYVFDMGR